MPKLFCPHCGKSNDYVLDKPKFCGFCGESLSSFKKKPVKNLVESEQYSEPLISVNSSVSIDDSDDDVDYAEEVQMPRDPVGIMFKSVKLDRVKTKEMWGNKTFTLSDPSSINR